MKLQRIEFIDLAKGICIIWVILWHINILPAYIPGLNSVRMPLYFILSGLFFKTYGDFNNLVIKKINKILIPFLFFYITGYILFYFVDYISPGLIQTDANSIFDIFTQRQYFNGPIWFLLSLFWANVIFCLISLNIRSEILKCIIVLVISTSGLILSHYKIFLPMTLDNTMTALLFFYVGYMLKQSSLLYPNRFDKYNILIGLFFYLGACSIDLFFDNPRFAMSTNNVYGNPLMAYIVSLFSVFAILFICKAIKYIPFISYFGRYSIIPLCTHHLVYRPIKLIATNYLHIPSDYLGISIAVATILICFVSIPICIKFLPYVTAQKDILHIRKVTPQNQYN